MKYQNIQKKKRKVMILYTQHKAWRRLRMGPKNPRIAKKRLNKVPFVLIVMS
jgi:hypothetical protein